jgi:hypothetical protein
MVEINILGIVDTQGNPTQITITGITQDEPVNELGDGNFLPDGAGVGTDTAQIRSERSGLGNGRVYNIRFLAQDTMGANCRGSVNVYVPHDKKHIPVDDGQIYDSTVIP